MRVSAAIAVLFDETAGTNHAFWPNDVSLLDEQPIDHSRVPGPRPLTDIYSVALAVKHGGRWVTCDRRFPRLRYVERGGPARDAARKRQRNYRLGSGAGVAGADAGAAGSSTSLDLGSSPCDYGAAPVVVGSAD